MGRPKKQTVDYFPHFVSTDSRTRFILEDSWGNDGYAFWFKLLELLCRSEGHYYDCSEPANEKYLVALMKIEQESIDKIIETLIILGNIDKELWEKNRIIWCQGLVDNLQDVYSKRTVAVPTKPDAGELKELHKESAGLEEPKNDGERQPTGRKKRESCLTAKQQELFKKFYAAYPKKVDPATAERAWAKIDPPPDEEMTERIIKAVEAAKKYDDRFRERQFIPNPASWLNAKGYMNEYGGNDDEQRRTDTNRGHFGAQPTDPGGFKPSVGFKNE